MPDFLTPTELAQRARITVRTLQKLEAAGRGPRRTSVGRRVLYAIEDANAWLQALRKPDRATA